MGAGATARGPDDANNKLSGHRDDDDDDDGEKTGREASHRPSIYEYLGNE